MLRRGMSRRYLPFDAWPSADRAAWVAAIAKGDILDGQGPAAHWAEATKRTNLQHYSRWLAFLVAEHLSREGLRPEERVTPDVARAYVARLQAEIAPRTVVSALVGLKVVIKAMAPDANWRWLADVCNALNRRSLPSKDKRARMRPTGEIYATALAELSRLSQTALRRRIDQVAFRDTLMLAILAARPLRLRNLAGIRIGCHLVRQGDVLLLAFPAEEVKNRRPLEHTLPDRVAPFVQTYLERIRPSFLKGRVSDALWLGFEGKPLTPHSIYLRIMLVSERLLGVAINPHLLRDCAATSLATVSPAAALSAAALLGHRSFATTERYYIRANQLDAGRAINAILADIRSGT
jgi:integrase